jgi:RHS repeat-associated protein
MKPLYILAIGIALIFGCGVVQAGTVTRTSSFEYDATTGLLTKEIIEPDNSQLRLETVHEYDAYGNKVSSTVSSPATGTAGIEARKNTITYDAQGRFPIASSNALQQTESQINDVKFGVITSLTGPNGLTTRWEYDNFGRKVREFRADGTRTRWDYYYCRGINGGTSTCPNLAKYLIQVTPLAANGKTVNGAWTKTYFDELEREIKSETLGFDGVSVISVNTEYDSLGRVSRKSLPYYNGQSIQWTVHEYDSLDRIKSITDPDSSKLNFAYNGLRACISNALNQTKTTVKNSQGHVLESIDAQNNIIRYQYDPFGNLTKTTDPQGNVITATYDLRGRKTQMIDPDMGSWSYYYDVLGQIVKKTDAKGQVSSMAYDKVGRMVQRSEPDLTSSWTFDTCTKGIGKLCQARADNGYSRSIGYDALGRPSSTSTTIDSVYTSSVTYDANGRIATQTYPNRLVIKYIYTSLGRLKEIRNNATNALYWQANAYDAEGHLTQQLYGNNVITQQIFEATTGRIKNIYAGAGNSIQSLNYNYDSVGNLLSRTDNNQALSETFLYDNLNRLTSTTINAPSGTNTLTYTYNAIGNILSRSDLGNYTYGNVNAKPHAVAQIALKVGGKRTYHYDLNGSLTQEVQYNASNSVVTNLGRTVTYTSFNMPHAINDSATNMTFAYGPEHQRTTQTTLQAKTIYLHPDNTGGLFYEKEVLNNGSGSTIVHKNFITANGKAIAIVKQSGATTNLIYLHYDTLGSTTAITNEAGAVIERLAYEPFGKRRTPTGIFNATLKGVETDRGFTSHEHLEEFGLIHMNGRVYDPLVGRFMSADPLIQEQDNLQSYNRYSYVMNNPLMFIDPSGYSAWTDFRDDVLKPIATIAIAYYTGQWVTFYTGSAIIGGAAGGFAGGLVGSGGDFRSGVNGAVTGGLMGWAGGVGGSESVGRYAAHAVAGCASGELSGGGCARGSVSAMAGHWGTNLTSDLDLFSQFTATTILGGSTSLIAGGTFKDGARTAIYGYLFNYCAHNGCFEKPFSFWDARDQWRNGKGSTVTGVHASEIDLDGATYTKKSNGRYLVHTSLSTETGLIYGTVTGVVNKDGTRMSFKQDTYDFDIKDPFKDPGQASRVIKRNVFTVIGLGINGIMGSPYTIEFTGSIPTPKDLPR